MRFCFRGCVNIPPNCTVLSCSPNLGRLNSRLSFYISPQLVLGRVNIHSCRNSQTLAKQVPVSGELSMLPMLTPFIIVRSHGHTMKSLLPFTSGSSLPSESCLQSYLPIWLLSSQLNLKQMVQASLQLFCIALHLVLPCICFPYQQAGFWCSVEFQ